MARSPQDVAKKWADRTKNSGQAYKDGVNSVTDSPMEKAAAKADKYRQAVIEAVDNGDYQRGLRSVSLADWKAQTAELGARRLVDGAAAAQGKMANFLGEFLPFQESVAAQVNAMPDNTLEERIAKSAENARKLAQFRRSRR